MERINDFLHQRKRHNLLRELQAAVFRRNGTIRIKDKDYIDLSCNDYLGLANHPTLKEAAKKAIDTLGTGAGASRLLSGDLEIHHQLEKEIAFLKAKESALVFNSGYQANVGIINALCSGGDVVFFDKLAHASIIDGILLSNVKYFRFHHNDCKHLEFLLNKQRKNFKNAFIVTETVFSMDGDTAALKELVELKKRYNCKIMVDEAHATGVFGKNGAGLTEEKGLNHEIDFIMGTFSKALGSFGAYFACSENVKKFLVNMCRSFIYSTALPPSVIAANLSSLQLIKDEPFRRQMLLSNADKFRNTLKEKGFSVRGSSQIVPLIVGESEKAVKLANALRENGWWVLPIRPPTVPAKEARLRFSLSYSHTPKILEKLIYDICSNYNI
ncbi:MAG: 8-amino-7-oxononanoate synthase [Candidatus Omnitrophica bacterium]|nr:8-amino-7-oxononanoate synthase [Candidatus Omnitrophota bacterium]